MFQFHGTFYLVVFAVVMLHELGIAVRFGNLAAVFQVMVLKGKTGVVTLLVYFVKPGHQFIKAVGDKRGVASEKFPQLVSFHSQQLCCTVFAGFCQFNVIIDCVSRDV